MANYDIYGIGAALVDTEVQVSNEDLQNFSIEKGVMTLVDESRQHELSDALQSHLVHSKRASGGSAANSIIAASYFGATNFYSCKVADDDNGRFYLNDLDHAGVSFINHKKASDQSGITGKCLVMITPDAERTMNTFLGISETLSEQDIDLDALAQSEWAYIEGYLVTSATGKPAAEKVRARAIQNNTKVAVSLSDPFIAEHFRDGMHDIIGDGVELIFCNEDEAISFTKAANFESACDILKTHCNQFAITRGAKGALIFDGKSTFEVAGKAVNAVDTNGAGDMFAGAFLYALCKGMTHQAAAELANRAAAVVVSQYGPRLAAEQHKALLTAG